MKASSSSLGAQRPVVSASRVARSVVARAADNLQRPELKRPEEAAAPAAPAPAPASPAPTAPSASSAPAPGSGPTIEYQRTRAKAMRSYFQQLKVNEQIKQSQVFGWTKSNEISNGRWVSVWECCCG